MKPSFRIVALGLVVALLGACSGEGAPSDRAGWLQTTLVEDNQAIIARDPALMRGKFAKMASSPYYFFRGTSAQFYRDLTDAGVPYARTAFASAPASAVLLVGDPHPENIGTFLGADGRMDVEFNDFEGARYGPFHFDVRRLAVGWGVAAETIGPTLLEQTVDGLDARTALIKAVAQGYVDEIDELADGQAPLRIDPDHAGPIVADLAKRARKDGDKREALQDYTRVENGARHLYFGVVDPPQVDGVINDEMVAVPARQRRMIEGLLAQYPVTLVYSQGLENYFKIKGIARRLGGGVASYALMRFYVLVEGPSASPDDDRLLEVKETRDTPAIPDLAAFPSRQFANNSQRAVYAQRTMQLDDQEDPLLGWAAIGAESFKVRERTKYQKGLGVDDFAKGLSKGDWQPADLVALARLTGALLARSHARAPRRDGGDALAAIAEQLHGREQDFVDETTRFADAYTDQVMRDFATFNDLLDSQGPLLGAGPTRVVQ